MPIYLYQCDICARIFEQNRKISERDAAASCPTCGQPLRRLLAKPTIQFKGNGFYSTDYYREGEDDD